METQVVNLIVKGTTFLHVTILFIGTAMLIPSFVILPKNRKVFKHFDRNTTRVVRYQNVSYYLMPEIDEITIQML